ncbi:MAG TPA: hypothetical protein VD887_07945 [Allosphingosinicella sp.]|nr:hypothetical protein [Allosphingosinicella sp.]
MSWGRLLLYLGYALALTVLAAVVVTGLAIGDCSLETVDCGEDRRLVAFGVLGAWAIMLLFLAVRFLHGPSKRP